MYTWFTVDSPIGPVSLASTGTSLARVAFSVENPPTGTDHDEILDRAAAWLSDYFAGTIRPIDVPLELPAETFTQRAQHLLATIPAGETRSYAWLAQQAGSPNAVRAAGSACASNPLPLFLPCHRIVRTDGQIGNYRGGTLAKQWLLRHEGNLGTTTAV